MNHPTGTVTFLFTDIEGSTRLWEQYPEAMRLALARHDRLLRDAIQKHHGYVFKTVGDAFCAAFPAATDAVNAAMEVHLALLELNWEDTGPLRVRMGLHTGEAEERDNDYFGQALNRVARLQGVGYGQQTLLSQVTYELVRDVLPPLTSIAELGSHRLKDLQRPELVFQLLHPALPSDFPPLKSLDNPKLPNNLPQQLTSFVGREKEMAEVKALLANTRLLTLLAMGGSGKTRLSLQVAADLLDADGDGVWFVELAALTDPGLVAQEMAHVLGVSEQPGKTITQCLTDYLKTKHLLLILDNCEHLIEACARLADTLLRNCPQVQVLATSREALGIVGEQTYHLSTLSVPQAPEQATASNLSQYEAVQLFIARAVGVQPSFAVTNANAPALAQICVRLDGIPLALELAAARVRSLPLQEINAKLDQRFRLLTGGSRTALPRQQTLRALIDWSYDLLGENEKAMLLSLSVFSGGWSLEAAERVCSREAIVDWEVFDLLTTLVDKSLVNYEERREAGRYRLLETVRQYAGDRLAQSGAGDVYRRQHRDYFLALAEESDEGIKGPDQARWLDRLETEHDNLRQAMAFCMEEDDADEIGLRLGAALQRFWWTHGHFSEGQKLLITLLARPTAHALTMLRADALGGAGILSWFQGYYDSARSLYQESLEIRRELGDRQGIAASLGNLGNVAHDQGDDDSARSLYEESLAIQRELGNRHDIATTLLNMGSMSHDQGDYASARSMYQESLEIKRELGDRLGIAYSLGSLASLNARESKCETAARLWGAAERLREEIGAPLSRDERDEYDREVASERKTMGDEVFSTAWAEGQKMTLEQAIECALARESESS